MRLEARQLLNIAGTFFFALALGNSALAAPIQTTIREIVQGNQFPPETEVLVEGTVYYVDPHWNFCYLGDGSNFIFVQGLQGQKPEFGSRVHVQGSIASGYTNPKISVKSIVVESDGNGVDLAAKKADIRDLKIGDASFAEFDGAWIETTATVEFAMIESNRFFLLCLSGDESDQGRVEFTACLPRTSEFADLARYIGATVRFRGSLGLSINNRGEAAGLLVFLTDNIETIKTAPHPLSVPAGVNVAEVIRDESQFLTSGQVTFCQDSGFYIQDASSGAWINFSECNWALSPGANVEVLGFCHKSDGEDSQLEARVCRSTNSEQLPEPKLTSIVSIFRDRPEAKRVRVQGSTTSHSYNDGVILVGLESGESKFDVKIPATEELYQSLNLESALATTVAGTCTFDASPGNHFSLFVPSVADLQISKRRSSVSGNAFGLGLTVATVLFALCFLWGKSLRDQVRDKTSDLSQLTAELRSSLDSIQDGIVFIGSNQKVRAVNDKAMMLFDAEMSPDDSVDSVAAIFARAGIGDNFLNEWRQFNENEHDEVDVRFSTSVPDKRSLVVRSSPVADSDDKFVGRVWAFYDVTEREALQEALGHAQKQEAIGRMAGGFAHDFNNLLTGIIGSLSVMQMHPNQTVKESSEQIEIAFESAERATALVSQLLGFSRRTRLDLAVSNVNDIVTELEPSLRSSMGSNIALEINLSDEVANVNVDAVKLEQVIVNICLNARDALHDGGTITVSTQSKIRCRPGSNEMQEFTEISIRDTGIGMSSEVRDKIFEPFFTTKKESASGLGLAMCDGIVHQHNGWIRCDSLESVGSEFQVFLPVTQESLSTPRQRPYIADTSLDGRTILIVDDESIVRSVSAKILRSYGANVHTAASGSEGITFLTDRRSEIDLVLLDWTMPGMSGKETLMRIKEISPNLPTIICSGYVFDTSTVEKQTSVAPEAVIQKPFTSKKITSEIQRVLHSAPATAEAA